MAAVAAGGGSGSDSDNVGGGVVVLRAVCKSCCSIFGGCHWHLIFVNFGIDDAVVVVVGGVAVVAVFVSSTCVHAGLYY